MAEYMHGLLETHVLTLFDPFKSNRIAKFKIIASEITFWMILS